MIKTTLATFAVVLLISGTAHADAMKTMELSAKAFCGTMQDSTENAQCMASMNKMMMKHMKKMKMMKK